MKKILFAALIAVGMTFGIANACWPHEIENEQKGCDRARVCLEKNNLRETRGQRGLLPDHVWPRELRRAHAPGKIGNAREEEIVGTGSIPHLPPPVPHPAPAPSGVSREGDCVGVNFDWSARNCRARKVYWSSSLLSCFSTRDADFSLQELGTLRPKFVAILKSSAD